MSDSMSGEESVASMSLADEQRAAIWKWRWLGLRKSTPAFKASLVLLGAVLFALVSYWFVVAR